MILPVPGPTVAEWVRLFEAVHVGLTERDQVQAQADQWQDTAEKCAAEAERLRLKLAQAERQLEEYEAIRQGLTEELGRLRHPPVETVKTGGKL